MAFCVTEYTETWPLISGKYYKIFTVILLDSSFDQVFLAVEWILCLLKSYFLILVSLAIWKGWGFIKPSNLGSFLFNSSYFHLSIFFLPFTIAAKRNSVAPSILCLEVSLVKSPPLDILSTLHITAGHTVATFCLYITITYSLLAFEPLHSASLKCTFLL